MREVIKYLGILFLLLLTYSSLLGGEFVYDGDVYILHNPVVSNSEVFWKYFSTFQLEQFSYILFRGMHSLWGYNPTYFHLMNLAIHFFNTILLIQVIRKLKLKHDFLLGALFALSPLCVFVAGWIFQVRSTIAVFFCLSSFLFYLKSKKSISFLILSLICFFLSLYAKGTALLFPLMLTGFAFVYQEKRKVKELAKLIPFYFVLGLFGWLYVRGMNEQIAIIDDFQGIGSFWQRLMLVGQNFWFYLGKIAFPFSLKFLYPKPDLNIADGLAWLPLGILLGAGGSYLLFNKSRVQQMVCLLFAIFFMALFPVLGFFDIGHMRYSFVGIHWAYFANIIFVIGLSAFLTHQRLVPSRWVEKFLMLIISVFVFFSFQESKRFMSMESFMLAAIEDNPQSYMGYYNLGVDHVRKKLYQDAIAAFEKTLELFQEHATVHLGLAEAYARVGLKDQAKESLKLSLERSETPERLMLHLGRVFIESRFFTEAVFLYESYHQERRGTWKSWTELGIAYAMTQDLEKSLKALQYAAALDPENEQVLTNLENTKKALELKRSAKQN